MCCTVPNCLSSRVYRSERNHLEQSCRVIALSPRKTMVIAARKLAHQGTDQSTLESQWRPARSRSGSPSKINYIGINVRQMHRGRKTISRSNSYEIATKRSEMKRRDDTHSSGARTVRSASETTELSCWTFRMMARLEAGPPRN